MTNQDQKLSRKIMEADKADRTLSWNQSELWVSIESSLEIQSSKPNYKWLAYAATVAILIGAFSWVEWVTNDGIQLSTEPISHREIWMEDRSAAVLDEGKAFIAASCKKQLPICSSEEFLTLYQELDLIEVERVAVQVALRHYGQDEILIQALIDLENTESSITNELIQLILS